jgi:hypothetical protein
VAASAVVANALLLTAPAWAIERLWLAGGWLPWQAFTSWLHALVPLPVSAWFALLTLVAALVWTWWRPAGGRASGWRAAAPRRRGARPRRALLAVLLVAAVLISSFVPAWGAAYRRMPLADHLRLSDEGARHDALLRAFDVLVERVHASAPDRPLSEAADPELLAAAVAAASRCVADTDALLTGRRLTLPPTVRVTRPGLLLRAGYAGISLPWLLEPYVDGGLPAAARLSVASHELAHTAGWAREADTDAVAVLAGLTCGHDWVRYAAALHGLEAVRRSLQPLLAAGTEEQRRVRAALEALPDAALRDREAQVDASRRWRQPTVAGLVTIVYDGYLRSQGVAAGVADYDAAGALVASALTACGPEPAAPWCH